MHYDVIVIGATFTAAGLIQEYGDDCLILERRPQAGYEFFNAVHFGTGYDRPLHSDRARRLQETFLEKGAIQKDRVCLFECAAAFYQLLEGKNVMLNMELVSIEKEGDGFTVTAHGVSGYRVYSANKIIDTRVHPFMVQSKTINLLASGEPNAGTPSLDGLKTEKWGYETDLLIQCPVPKDADYTQARAAVTAVMKKLPEGWKAALVADMFDDRLMPSYPKPDDGIVYMPSRAYQNPLLAFDAGVIYAQGGAV